MPLINRGQAAILALSLARGRPRGVPHPAEQEHGDKATTGHSGAAQVPTKAIEEACRV